MSYFSIILPTYNRSTAIKTAIDSVIQQTYEDWELLVVSDGSTDDTEAVVEGYDDVRIRLIRLPENHGHPGRPRNVGLYESHGQIVTYLDHDDCYHPDHLALLREAFDERGARIIATGCRYLNRSGGEIKSSSFLEMLWHPEFQVIGPLFQPSRVAHHREVVQRHGGWTEQLAGLEDWELWLRLADAGEQLVTSPVKTVAIYSGNDTRLNRVPMKYTLTVARVRDESEAWNRSLALKTSDGLAELRRLHVEESQKWYEELHNQGEIHLPQGITFEQVLYSISQEVPQNALGPLAIRSSTDTAVSVVMPLMCVSVGHARRIRSLLQSRFPRKLKYIQKAFSSGLAVDSSADSNDVV